MMFTRVAPLRLRFSLMGSRTLVARTISCRTPRKALPTKVSLSPRLYTSAVSMKLMPLSRASFTIRVVSSWPRLPMFILPPNCIVPSATSLTISPVFHSFLYFISHTPSAANEKLRRPIAKTYIQLLGACPLDLDQKTFGSSSICFHRMTSPLRSGQFPFPDQHAFKSLTRSAPTNEMIQKSVEKARPGILIVKIIGVLPKIRGENWHHAVM